MTDKNIINNQIENALAQIENATSIESIEAIRIDFLGKKGTLSEAMKGLSNLSIEEKKEFGGFLNQKKSELTTALEHKKQTLEAQLLHNKLMLEKVDITLPCRTSTKGTLHPVSRVMEEMILIFSEMGFSVAEGPDIESDDYNFDRLNIPATHPARQMHDTFYFAENDHAVKTLLRTHTSPVQIRTMLKDKPPIRIIAPGRTYRCDSDMTHTPMFHQLEGLVIDKAVHLGHLRGCLQTFCERFFGLSDIKMRFRPSYFPFTEPSMEVDIGCDRSGGKIKIGQGNHWLEVLGSGMVHPNVLRNCGLDPEEYQGFAFGLGIDRFAMLKYGIADLRSFFESDLRWLKHYGFSFLDSPALAA